MSGYFWCHYDEMPQEQTWVDKRDLWNRYFYLNRKEKLSENEKKELDILYSGSADDYDDLISSNKKGNKIP